MLQKAMSVDDKSLMKFIDVFTSLNKHNLTNLRHIYADDVVFEDPAHHITGFDSLMAYFQRLYANVNECFFDIHDYGLHGESAFLNWTMHLSHPSLNNGVKREVRGCTYLIFSGNKVVHHRDYFDLGEMLYEAIPLLGSVIRTVKRRLGQ